MSDPLLALLPAAHPLAATDRVRWSDLAQSDWVIESGDTLFTQQVTAHCRRAGFEPRIRARVRDFATQAALISALGLVAVVPRTAVTLSSHVTARPLLPDLRRALMIVARHDLVDQSSAGHLIAALQRVADTVS